MFAFPKRAGPRRAVLPDQVRLWFTITYLDILPRPVHGLARDWQIQHSAVTARVQLRIGDQNAASAWPTAG